MEEAGGNAVSREYSAYAIPRSSVPQRDIEALK
jgi:hypothetical protein